MFGFSPNYRRQFISDGDLDSKAEIAAEIEDDDTPLSDEEFKKALDDLENEDTSLAEEGVERKNGKLVQSAIDICIPSVCYK